MAEDALPPVETDAIAAPLVDASADVIEAPLEPKPAIKPKAEPKAAAPVVKAQRKLAPKARPAAVKAPVVEAEPVNADPVKAKPARSKPAKAKPEKVKAVPAKPVPPEAPVAVKSPVFVKPSIRSKPIAKAKPVARPKPLSEIFPMSTTDFTATIKSALADVQGKAKAAYEKGAASFSEGTEFTKGNVEAVVESSKILAEGLQKLGTDFVAESRSAFETLTAEAKELAAVKTPTDFFKLQSDLLRKHFDSAIAYGSKQTEAVVKLGTESIAPISSRVTLALEVIKKAA